MVTAARRACGRSASSQVLVQLVGPQPPGGFTRQPRPKRADRPRDHRQADDEAPLDSLSSSVPVVPLLYAARPTA